MASESIAHEAEGQFCQQLNWFKKHAKKIHCINSKVLRSLHGSTHFFYLSIQLSVALSLSPYSKFGTMTINLSLILTTTRIQKQFPLSVLSLLTL